MRVLVAAASRHGSTTGIAERIAAVLGGRAGIEAVVRAPQDVEADERFDAYVVGSAIYMGHWLDPARELVRRHDGWRGRPVWLFSSGPIGDPPKPNEQPVDVGEAVATTGAREHRLFAGALIHDRLGFGERAMVAAFRAQYGDFRDWAAIDAWAAGIADVLGTG